MAHGRPFMLNGHTLNGMMTCGMQWIVSWWAVGRSEWMGSTATATAIQTKRTEPQIWWWSKVKVWIAVNVLQSFFSPPSSSLFSCVIFCNWKLNYKLITFDDGSMAPFNRWSGSYFCACTLFFFSSLTHLHWFFSRWWEATVSGKWSVNFGFSEWFRLFNRRFFLSFIIAPYLVLRIG